MNNTHIAPLRVVDPICWQDRPIPPRRWIVKDMIPNGSVTMLSGDGGVGKSLLTLQLCVAVATGRSFIGLETEPCKSFGVYSEDDEEEMHRRLAGILDEQGLGFADLENFQFVSRVGEATEFMVRDKYGKARGPSAFFGQVLHQAKTSGAQLVILDGLHDLFDGNENSRPEARQFINLLRKIALEIDGAVVLCAHPSMSGISNGTGNAGSTAWNNAVRSRLYFTRATNNDGIEDDTNARTLKNMKANYTEKGGGVKLRYQNGMFVPDAPEFGTVANIARRAKEREVEEAFLAGLDNLLKSGRFVTDKVQGSYAPKVIATLPVARGFHAKVLEAAMSRLFATGTIRLAKRRRPNRHFGETLVRAEVPDDE